MLGLRPEVREVNGRHGKTDKFTEQLSGRFCVSGDFRKTRSKRPEGA